MTDPYSYDTYYRLTDTPDVYRDSARLLSAHADELYQRYPQIVGAEGWPQPAYAALTRAERCIADRASTARRCGAQMNTKLETPQAMRSVVFGGHVRNSSKSFGGLSSFADVIPYEALGDAVLRLIDDTRLRS